MELAQIDGAAVEQATFQTALLRYLLSGLKNLAALCALTSLPWPVEPEHIGPELLRRPAQGTEVSTHCDGSPTVATSSVAQTGRA
jgi:hypothetical protein